MQQTDGLTCAYQMVLNMRDLADQPDIQKFVENKWLPERSFKMIESFVSDLKPSLI